MSKSSDNILHSDHRTTRRWPLCVSMSAFPKATHSHYDLWAKILWFLKINWPVEWIMMIRFDRRRVGQSALQLWHKLQRHAERQHNCCIMRIGVVFIVKKSLVRCLWLFIELFVCWVIVIVMPVSRNSKEPELRVQFRHILPMQMWLKLIAEEGNALANNQFIISRSGIIKRMKSSIYYLLLLCCIKHRLYYHLIDSSEVLFRCFAYVCHTNRRTKGCTSAHWSNRYIPIR